MLPGLDGLEVCRRIQQRGRVPVTMVTAKDDEADMVRRKLGEDLIRTVHSVGYALDLSGDGEVSGPEPRVVDAGSDDRESGEAGR